MIEPTAQRETDRDAQLHRASGGTLAPLFRWPGGKRWLVPQLLPLIPTGFHKYYEPFVGAGALFFALRPGSAHLADSNADLMACYQALRDDHTAVAAVLEALPRDRESYYRIRDESPEEPVARAARFIYLTTLAFNGIYRVNKQGRFNVPYGNRTYGALGSAEQLQPYSEALAAAEVSTADFEETLSGAGAGDVAYLDPPYTVAHANNGFLKYNDHIFSWEDQRRLAATAGALDRRGCVVIVSNAHHFSLAKLYAAFRRVTVTRSSVIAADADHRGPVKEYVFTNAG